MKLREGKRITRPYQPIELIVEVRPEPDEEPAKAPEAVTVETPETETVSSSAVSTEAATPVAEVTRPEAPETDQDAKGQKSSEEPKKDDASGSETEMESEAEPRPKKRRKRRRRRNRGGSKPNEEGGSVPASRGPDTSTEARPAGDDLSKAKSVPGEAQSGQGMRSGDEAANPEAKADGDSDGTKNRPKRRRRRRRRNKKPPESP